MLNVWVMWQGAGHIVQNYRSSYDNGTGKFRIGKGMWGVRRDRETKEKINK